ncbi:hypothetical protein HK105_204159 [Polyrhizophydium stewartii]|uniref:Cytochrome P450 n=1 Tax=Polyrhizophydium stewartii TaxID=2732419 RepID=A0ABR4NA56_9FUNG|nr:hypothetical protein HK105_001615 [Polyrhizophydium stewartii]
MAIFAQLARHPLATAVSAVLVVLFLIRRRPHRLDRAAIKAGLVVPPRAPAPFPFIGNLIAMGIHPGHFIIRGHKKYGDVFSTTVMQHNFVFVTGKSHIMRVTSAPERQLSLNEAYKDLFGFIVGTEIFVPVSKSVFSALTSSRVEAMTPALMHVTQRYLENKFKGDMGKVDMQLLINELVAVLSVSLICGGDFGLEYGPEVADNMNILETDYSVFSALSPFETAVVRRRRAARLRIMALVEAQARKRVEKLRDQPMKPTDDYFDRLVHVMFYGRVDKTIDETSIANEFADNDKPEGEVDPRDIPEEERIYNIVISAFGLIYGAHTNTSVSAMAHLCEILPRPEYMDILRKDFVDHLGNDAITSFKAYLTRVNATPRGQPKEVSPFVQMRTTNRILSESLRVHLDGGMLRKALEDVHLDNGVTIPKGSFVIINAYPILASPRLYGADGETWNPNRLIKPIPPGEFDESSTGGFSGKLDDLQSPLVRSSDLQMSGFGSGRHLCPGRFHAYRMINQMTAQMLVNFDFVVESNFDKWWPVPYGGTARPLGKFIVFWKRRV